MNPRLETDNRTDFTLSESQINAMEQAVFTALSEAAPSFEGTVSLSVVSEDEIKKLNARFRRMDKVTDVLSFPSGEGIDGEFLGDIVICYQRALEQAQEYGHGIERELGFLCVHSILHLLDFDHGDEMFGLSEKILNKIGLNR